MLNVCCLSVKHGGLQESEEPALDVVRILMFGTLRFVVLVTIEPQDRNLQLVSNFRRDSPICFLQLDMNHL